MKSIKVRLTGGIGNQLFQIVAGLAVGKLHNQSTIFLTNNLQKNIVKHENDLENHFAVQFSPGNLFSRNIFLIRIVRILDRIIKKFASIGNLFLIHNSREIGYTPQILTKQYRRLHGLYQTFKYLELVRDELEIYTRNEKPTVWYQTKLQEIENQSTVAIHIRRGDYKNVSLINGILGAKYYQKALSHIREISRGENLKYFVFSDSMDEAKGLIGELNVDFQWINSPSESCSFETILLMSKCDYQIIANSTFSWWGAALAKNSKLVICPASWMRKDPQPSEIYPSSWFQIESDWLT
jgi:hypothetical protein